MAAADAVLRFEIDDKTKKGRTSIIGGLKSMINPATLAAGAVTGVGAGLLSMFKGAFDTEKALRPMIERARVGGEVLQTLTEVAKRTGSEDGLEGVTDTIQELQLQLGEIEESGKSRALPFLEKLNLNWEDLIKMSPEDAWRKTVEEIQKIPNVAQRAVAAEEIYGGSSEKIAGILNLTNEEFAEMEAHVKETSDIMSDELRGSTQKASIQLDILGGTLGRVRNWALTPLMSAFADGLSFLNTDLVPFMKRELIPVFDWFGAKTLPVIRKSWEEDVKPSFENMFNTMKGQILPMFDDIALAVSEYENKVGNSVFSLENIFDTSLESISGLATGIVDGLEESIVGGLKIIGGTWSTFTDLLTGDWKSAWESLPQTALDIMLSIPSVLSLPMTIGRNMVRNFFEGIVGHFEGSGEAIKDFFKDIPTDINNFFKSLWSNIKSSVGQFITDFKDGIGSGISDALTPSWLQGLRIGPGGTQVPKMASGGIVTRPTLAMIGEAGPEAVIPLGKMGSRGNSIYAPTIVQGSVYANDLPGMMIDTVNQGIRRGTIPIENLGRNVSSGPGTPGTPGTVIHFTTTNSRPAGLANNDTWAWREA